MSDKLSFMIKIDFPEWIQKQMDQRGMTQADVVRSSGLSSAQISKIINMKSSPSAEAVSAIANALDLPQETVYRAAGLLPDLPTPRDQYEEIIRYRLSVLDDAQLENVLRYIEFISSESQKPVRTRSE